MTAFIAVWGACAEVWWIRVRELACRQSYLGADGVLEECRGVIRHLPLSVRKTTVRRASRND